MMPQKRQKSLSWVEEDTGSQPLKVARRELASQYLGRDGNQDVNCTKTPSQQIEASKPVGRAAVYSSIDDTRVVFPASRANSPGFSDLPDDILLHIFGNCRPVPDLCCLMEVCKKFSQLCLIPQLWKSVQAIDSCTRKIYEVEYESACKVIDYDSDNTNKHAQTTSASRKSRQNRKSVSFVVDFITSRARSCLVSLDLGGCYPDHPNSDVLMTDGDLDLIAERSAGSLQSLRISPSYFITASGLLSFAKSCPNLVALHMTRCEYMTDRKLGEIVLVCPTLEDISVSRCWQIRGRKLHDKLRPVQKKLKRLDISVTGVLNLQMAKFMKGYPALEVINAGDCHMLQEEYRRSDPSSSFPNLAYLNLDRTDFVAQTWLKLTCMTSKNLRFLSLNMLRSKIYRIEEILDVELPPLKYLGLAGQDITDPMWQMIYEKLGKSLIQCDLSRNKSLSGALVVRDGNFSVLECLSLRGTRITSENLESLINLAPRLKSLDLSGCRWVERALRRTPFSFKEQASTKGGKQ